MEQATVQLDRSVIQIGHFMIPLHERTFTMTLIYDW